MYYRFLLLTFKSNLFMSSSSENTFGRVLGNAVKVYDHVNALTDFVPERPNETAAALLPLIDDAKLADKAEAAALATYRKSTSIRRELFFVEADSLAKRYTDINSAVRRQYGLESSEYATISGLIAKCRNSRRPKRDPARPDAVHNSQSQQSYDSLTQSFSDIIASLESFVPIFTPANTRVKISILNNMLTELEASSQNINATTRLHTDTLNVRNTKFAAMTALAEALKEAVRGQYGLNSTQYKPIKSLRF